MHTKVGVSCGRGRGAGHAETAPQEGAEMLLSLYREERAYLLHIIRNGPHCLPGMEEDILQEAVEKLLAKAGRGNIGWESRNHCRSSLLVTARNLAVDHCRREARRSRLFIYQAELGPGPRGGGEDGETMPDYEELAAGTCAVDGPEESLLRTEELSRARGILSSLGEEDKRLLLMREELRLPWGEISAAVGIRADALRVRYSRLKAWLRGVLRDDYGCCGP